MQSRRYIFTEDKEYPSGWKTIRFVSQNQYNTYAQQIKVFSTDKIEVSAYMAAKILRLRAVGPPLSRCLLAVRDSAPLRQAAATVKP